MKISRLAIDCFLSRFVQPGRPVERTKIAELQASGAGGRREQVPGFGAKHLFSVGVPEEFVVWNQVTWGLRVQLSGFRCNEC
jgi:hypothetical protein